MALSRKRILIVLALTLVLLLTGMLLLPAHAQAYTVLYNFSANANDPLQPVNLNAIAQGRVGGTSSYPATVPQQRADLSAVESVRACAGGSTKSRRRVSS